FLPGLIGVETKDHFIDEPFQNPRLRFGESGALWGDHILDPSFEQRNQIELPFTHDRAICFDQRSFTFVEAEKDTPFLEERRFGGVQIFRDLRVRFEQSPTERDDFSNIVANRENDAAAKTVVNFVARLFLVTWFHQTALQKLGARVAALERPFQKCVPAIRRETELPVFGDLFVDPALLQILPRWFCERLL